MDGKGITAEELKQAGMAGFGRLAEEVAKAMNSAHPGRIIADTEDASLRSRPREESGVIGGHFKRYRAFSLRSLSAWRREEHVLSIG